MTEQRKRLIRNRKRGSEELPLEPAPPIVNSQPIQQPQPTQVPQQPPSKRDSLFSEDTQTCTVTVDDIKAGQVRVFVEGNLDPQIIKLPKPIALALRMAYREGLNSSKQPKIITTKQSQEEELVIRAAEEMANFLRKLGHCHGKTEENLLDAVKVLKESRGRPPTMPPFQT